MDSGVRVDWCVYFVIPALIDAMGQGDPTLAGKPWATYESSSETT